MNISEDSFVSWSAGPSQTETDKCVNAETAVRKALQADKRLAELDITVFAQGSYMARTNVRQDSDVDICVRYNGAFFPEYPADTDATTFGNIDGKLPFADFKNMVGDALIAYFGSDQVSRGKKAFDVHANTYRIDADVVPTFEHRRYSGKRNTDNSWHYYTGVAFLPDGGGLIKNWPAQNYENGVARNTDTRRRYKRVIRILKRLRNKMQDEKIAEAANVASFLIEGLVWNTSLAALQRDTYTETIRDLIIEVWNATKSDEACKEWVEVNGMKWLFRSSQPWTSKQVHDFTHAAWNFIGYK